MRTFLLVTIVCAFYFGQSEAGYTREKRLIRYPFPGPRADFKDENAEAYRAAVAAPRVKRKPQYEELADDYSKESYPSARPARSGVADTAAQTYRPTHADPYSDGAYRPSQPSGYSSGRSDSGSNSRYQPSGYNSRASSAESYGSPDPKNAKKEAEEEEEKKPSRLELLLAQSKFTCQGKKDGYYADASVACQVFHYCVAGAKHSWQCPEGTVFHQVHLNCVPASQDICSQSEKFFVVNDYLHKPLDNQGPNNTVRYHQRYYPEEFLGDPLTAAFPGSQSFPPKPVAGGAAPQGSGYSSYEEDYDNDGPRRPSSSYRPSLSSAPVRSPSPRSQPGYSSYPPAQPKPVAPQQQPPYALSAKPYSGYPSSSGSRGSSSYSGEDSNERSAPSSYNRPTPSPYSGSTRYPGPSSYPSSPISPASVSSYTPYKPASLSSPSPSYGYSRSSSPSSSLPSSYSPSINPKSSSVPYSSYPSYSPYSSSAYGSSAASERSLRPASYSPRSYAATSYKPNGYSGVTYEEDY